jgi:hypothetical protein
MIHPVVSETGNKALVHLKGKMFSASLDFPSVLLILNRVITPVEKVIKS